MMLAYGYIVDDQGRLLRRASGSAFEQWGPGNTSLGYPIRGVIGFHPQPKITAISRGSSSVTIGWQGANGEIFQSSTGTTRPITRQYVVERTTSLTRPFAPISVPTTNHLITIQECCTNAAFFRVQELLP
jgi:hypothetical protein